MAFVIGLTGGTGAGKSSLKPVFEEYGYTYIDTDRLARKVTEPDSPYLSRIIGVFGAGSVCKDGILDRHALAEKAFSSPVSAAVLNLLTHPAIIDMTLDTINRCGKDGKAVVDAPLLFESGMDKICDRIIAVTAPVEMRLQRIMARDGISEEATRQRISRQHDDAFYEANSDFYIVNDSSVDELANKVRRVLESAAVK